MAESVATLTFVDHMSCWNHSATREHIFRSVDSVVCLFVFFCRWITKVLFKPILIFLWDKIFVSTWHLFAGRFHVINVRENPCFLIKYIHMDAAITPRQRWKNAWMRPCNFFPWLCTCKLAKSTVLIALSYKHCEISTVL